MESCLPKGLDSLSAAANFDAGTMLVERAVVNGRIGPTKTETSKDEAPLDGELALILLEWRKSKTERTGLSFLPHSLAAAITLG